MRRKFGKSLLSEAASSDEELNPMEGLTNLPDVMLVLAVGLMLALVVNWNIDVMPKDSPEVEPPAIGEEVEVDGIDESEGTELDADSQYVEMGKVYLDPATGKYYVVTND
jgi:hypothetical protein